MAKATKKRERARDAWSRHGLTSTHATMIKRAVERFSEALRKRIEAAELSETDLSKAIGFRQGAVGNWSRKGARALPNLREVFLIAHELGVDPVDLVRPVSLAYLRGEPEPESVEEAATEAQAAPKLGNGYVDKLAGRLADRMMERVENRALEIVSERLAE